MRRAQLLRGTVCSRSGARIQMAGQADATGAHDLVVVPAEQRFCQWREQVHPRTSRADLPVVAHDGQAIKALQAAAADAFQLAFDPSLNQLHGDDPGHAPNECQAEGQNA